MKTGFSLVLIILFCGIIKVNAQNKDLVNLVNPLVGSDSEYPLSNGNTYPAIATPWGMNFWTPQTGNMGNGWGYTYKAYKIKGFKQTHQPSPWINDYGAFSLMPETGRVKIFEEDRASWFSHKAEISKPHYYKVYLADYDVTVEITPTERAAQFRFTFPRSDESTILLDAFNKGSYVKIIPEERKIMGYCKNNSGGVPANFQNYFVAYFDKDFETTATFKDSTFQRYNLEAKSKHVGAIVRFKTKTGEVIHVKVASSFISYEQAELNLKREIGNDTFDQTKAKAQEAWNKELGKITVEGGSDAQMTTFYTALYRGFLFPRKFYEFDKDNKVVHYSPYNGQVLPGYMFTDNGFWDTFRAVFPFFTLMQPELNSHIMEGLVNAYKESGWLPEWASPGHRDCMIGSNSASLIADSYLKGIRGYDINTLYEALVKNSNNAGPLSSVGRFGVKYYNSMGYIPYNVKVNENVARTLEYSYDDFCLSKLAKKLNRPQSEIDTFAKRSLYYRNVFDKSTNFARGKNLDGSWQSPFKPEKWGDAFTEGCSWHYTWAVFHDVQGLMNLMGGKAKFTEKLDSLFTASPKFDYSYYGVQIHEITEMAIAGLGQYAHGNQPIQHGIYLYDWAGEPWKAQKWVREVMNKLYTPNADGLCGDEDNGQTSVWYVFSAIGMYSVCPGSGQYALGAPLFKKVTLKLENGKSFVVNAPLNNASNLYIQKAMLNGKDYTRNFLTHEDILKGGLFNLQMSPTPNENRGIKKEDLPYSLSNE
jgi:predicted alpha-1,2-mannosidase